MFQKVALLLLVATVSAQPMSPPCRSYAGLMKSNLMEIVARHFQTTDPGMSEETYAGFFKRGLTPTKLFESRYGQHASAALFVKLSLTLAYADSPCPNVDRDRLRESMYDRLDEGRMDEARIILGQLVLLVNKLFVRGGDTIGVDQRCVTIGQNYRLAQTLEDELDLLKTTTNVELWEEFVGLRPANTSSLIIDRFFTVLATDNDIDSNRLSKRSASDEEENASAIAEASKSNKDYVVLVKREYSNEVPSLEIDFEVDGSISTIVLEATKQCGGMKVFPPNNTEGRPLKWLEDKLELKVESSKRVGRWILRSNGETHRKCHVTVSAMSTMGLFMTTVTPSKAGSGYQVLHSNPTPSDQLGFLLDFYGLRRSAKISYELQRIRLLSPQGLDIVDPIPYDADTMTSGGDVAGTVVFSLPAGFNVFQSFRVAVEGANAQGVTFQRVLPSLIQISSLLVEYNTNMIGVLRPGSRVKIPVSVTNYGDEDLVSVEVWDEMEMTSIKPLQRRIPADETRVFNLFYEVPEDAEPGSWSNTIVRARTRRSHMSSTTPAPTPAPVAPTSQTATSVAVIAVEPLRINSIIINSKVNSRFAETVIQTSVTNNYTKLREAEVDVLLPVDAFVTNFTMTVGENVIVGQVEEKKKADKIYNKAKQTGVSAGKVASRQKSQRDFRQSMTAAPNETIVFTVVYQQLLKRYLGAYDYMVMLNPNQPVKHLTLDIHIIEESPLMFVRTPGFNPSMTPFDPKDVSDTPPEGSVVTYSADRRAVHIRYAPSLEDQTASSPLGLNGAYSVLYDVDAHNMHGSMSVNNGYFTHFYAARSLPVRPKAVVYIMDISGSMGGNKMDQARETLKMLIDLHDSKDYFNIVLFNSYTSEWKSGKLMQATDENKKEASNYVEYNAYAGGGTNIKSAYQTGFDVFKTYLDMTDDEKASLSQEKLVEAERRRLLLSEHWKMICFLTDGMHTSDYTSNSMIAYGVRERNQDRVQVHNVAFGEGADYEFMQQISAENGGIDRRIFDNMDAAVAIKDFFYEVTNVMMTNVKFEYDSDKVESLTTNEFPFISMGKEVVLSGKINEELINAQDPDVELDFKIGGKLTGKSSNSEILIEFEVDTKKTSRVTSGQHKIDNFAERIWAYMTIKKLLQDAKLTTDTAAVEEINAKALELSLKYNFVTPLTSIVVMKDADRQKVMKALKKEEEAALTTTAAPVTVYTTTAPSITQPMTVPYQQNYGGMYRDPHVVLPLKNGVNLCFNWDGADHEVHNLIYHPQTGMAVNGMMVAAPAGIKSTTGKDRVYVHTVAFVIPLSQANIIITPSNITFKYHGLEPFTIDVTSQFSITRNGMSLYVYEVHGSMAKLQIDIDGVKYLLMLHRKSRVPHVDLAFDDLTHKKTSGGLDGVIGQYYGKGVHLTKSEQGDEGVIRVGKELSDVRQHLMKANPITHEQKPCWFSSDGGRALSKGERSRFVVDGLESQPDYTKYDNKTSSDDGETLSQQSVLTALFRKR